jgi:dihydroorotate dehydrogenase
LNIGKNASTPIEQASSDYVLAMEAVYEIATYITVNISSPNTQNLRALQGEEMLRELLSSLDTARTHLSDRYGVRKPLFLKIAPDLDHGDINLIADLLMEFGIDAVIATNTTISREAVQGMEFGTETGGLSGGPVRNASNIVIKALKARLGNQLPIIGVGGILSGADAREKIMAGASLVQLYSGLIYRGPELVSECAKALRQS